MVKTSIFTTEDIRKETEFIKNQLKEKGIVKKVYRTENEEKIIEYLLKHKTASQKQLFKALGVRSFGSLSTILNRLIFDRDVEVILCEHCDSAKTFRLSKSYKKKNNIV